MRRMICQFLLVSLLMCSSATAADKSPTEALKPVLDELTTILVDTSLKGDEHRAERRSKIMEVISHGFDFKEMSKRILGKTWRRIDDSQRVYFTRLIKKLLENVYIGKLESYSGQEIEFKAEIIKGRRAQVSTVIENKGVKIPVHYIMKQVDNRWMVYDINIEGVSLVRNYQQQFKPILRKEKFEGLIKVLEEKNNSFLREK
ncbi:MlaC/ttg2D family ABC transporter substrate-binding protein [Desulfomarina sp.]